jgi:hypothetical protein
MAVCVRLDDMVRDETRDVRAPMLLLLAAVGLLLVLPLALRMLPIRHGAPRNYVPDTHMVRQALGMARDHDLAPQAGKYSFYPNFLPYLLLPCYAAEYAAGRAEGRSH